MNIDDWRAFTSILNMQSHLGYANWQIFELKQDNPSECSEKYLRRLDENWRLESVHVDLEYANWSMAGIFDMQNS